MRRLAVVAVVTQLVVTGLVACGSDTSTLDVPPADGGGSDVVTPKDSGGSTDVESLDAGGDAPADAPPPGTCAAYCAAIMAACTGPNAQYASNASCLGTCATFPAAADGGDAGDDTLACRANHALLAATSPDVECANAGPTGGDTRHPERNAPPCGSGCQEFCDLAQTICDGTNKQFADEAVCLSVCPGYAPLAVVPYSTADMSANDFGCRMYWLTVAAESPASAVTNCPKIVPNSFACTK